MLKYLKTKIYPLVILKTDLKSLVKYLNEPDGETKIRDIFKPNINYLKENKFSNFTSIGYDNSPYYFFQILYKIIKTIYIEIIKIAYNDDPEIQTERIEENPLLNGLRSFLDLNILLLNNPNLKQNLQRIKAEMTPPSTPSLPPPPSEFLNDCIKIDVKDYDLTTTETKLIETCLLPIKINETEIEDTSTEPFFVKIKLSNLNKYDCYKGFLKEEDYNYEIKIIKDPESSTNNDYIIENSLDENEKDKKVKFKLGELIRENIRENIRKKITKYLTDNFSEEALYLISNSGENFSFPVIFTDN